MTEFRQATGLGEVDLYRPGGRVDALRHRRVIELLERLPMQAPLSIAERLLHFPNLAALWCNSPCLRDALTGYLHYRDVLGQFDAVAWQAQADSFVFEYHPDEPGLSAPANARHNFHLLLDIIHHYTQGEGCVMTLNVPDGATPAWRSLQELHPVSIRAHTGRFALHLHCRHLLDQPYACHNPYLYQHARKLLDEEMAALSHDTLFASQVAQVLDQVLGEPSADCSNEGLLEKVCQRLHMSRWTLQRHLQQEGTDFSSLLQRIRLCEAQRLLCETSLPLADIGAQLGFQSQSTFTRYFSNHFGCSPARFRKGVTQRPVD